MSVLVFNVGSTTLKYAEVDPVSGHTLGAATIDRIGQVGGDAADHLSAAAMVLRTSTAPGGSVQPIVAIGHRIVQGGDRFPTSIRVDDDVLQRLAKLDPLAPLHNPPARGVVESIYRSGVTLPQVLVFDTAYFSTMPPEAYRYAISESVTRDHGIRKYGFHGTSHQYVVEQTKQFLPQIDKPRIVSLHLGGGASATASIDGIAIDTSMGMTPLEGLVMATRCGDIDPAVPIHLIRSAGWSVDQVDRWMNKQSGLVGLCGDADMRRILARRDAGDESARLAIDIYVRRIVKRVGGYAALMGGIDALLFTAGVGQNAAAIRSMVCQPLAFLGIQIDPILNTTASGNGNIVDLSGTLARVRTLIVPTNEELAIARETIRILASSRT